MINAFELNCIGRTLTAAFSSSDRCYSFWFWLWFWFWLRFSKCHHLFSSEKIEEVFSNSRQTRISNENINANDGVHKLWQILPKI